MNGDSESEEDTWLFKEAMSKINTSNRNYKQQRFNSYDQRSIPEPGTSPKQFISTDIAEPVALDQTSLGESVLFVRAGLQRKVVKRLKRGEFAFQDVLDLHGMRVHQAESLLDNFLSDAIRQNLSCVLIIHGKGYHSENNRGVLKPYTIDWLKRPAEIKAFCSARPKDGGTGAVYVLLKRGISPD